MGAIGMNKTMSQKPIPFTLGDGRWVEDKPIKQRFVLPRQKADNDRKNNDKCSMIKIKQS